MGERIDVIWRIRLNDLCAVAMRPCVKLLLPLVKLSLSIGAKFSTRENISAPNFISSRSAVYFVVLDEHRKLDRFYCIVLRWRRAAAQTQSRTQLRAPIEWYHKCVSELERLNDDHRASTNFTVQYSKTNVEPRHGRPHIGANGVS